MQPLQSKEPPVFFHGISPSHADKYWRCTLTSWVLPRRQLPRAPFVEIISFFFFFFFSEALGGSEEVLGKLSLFLVCDHSILSLHIGARLQLLLWAIFDPVMCRGKTLWGSAQYPTHPHFLCWMEGWTCFLSICSSFMFAFPDYSNVK